MHKTLRELLSDDEKNILCNIELANAFGTTGALLIAYFARKTESKIGAGNVVKNGRIWCTETYEHITQETFSFMSTRTLERAIKKLEDQGVLLSEIFGNYKMDRTKSYSVDTDRLFEILEKGCE